MEHIDYTFLDPAANLACDEALLDLCDGGGPETLRFWESSTHFVALGCSNKAGAEARVAVCQERGVPILRRCSGGGAVLQGPGCLNFSVVLRAPDTGRNIQGLYDRVLARHSRALAGLLGEPVEIQGETDLTFRGLKFSGNAQRRKRRAALVHGTFLWGFDLSRMEEFLPLPSRRPAYRDDRPHHKFVCNLPASGPALKECLRAAWSAASPLAAPPVDAVQRLVREKYSRPEWTFKF
jgi:lipoate---protein ligase